VNKENSTMKASLFAERDRERLLLRNSTGEKTMLPTEESLDRSRHRNSIGARASSRTIQTRIPLVLDTDRKTLPTPTGL
jgi:hypothetical protein